MSEVGTGARTAAGAVLLTLAMAQFVMTLDTSVMNVAIATVAEDVGTTVSGIQTAITLYTLVMATLMITGGKLGQVLGRKRVFMLGCAVYGTGSLTTAASQSLPMLIFGWSLLEGIGAAMILPAIVALVASNFAQPDRPRAYGLVAAAGAIAVAAGPLIGGLFTEYLSWRLVFVGEVVVLLGVVAYARRLEDTPAEEGVKIDVVGTLLSAAGLGLIVYSVLQIDDWGFVQPKADAPDLLGLSLSLWLMLFGGVLLWAFLAWQRRRIDHGLQPLLDPDILQVPVLRSGLAAFMFQYLLQAGMFFTIPLYLSVALGLSAIETGLRVMPLSITLLLAAVGVPKAFPHASPRRVSQLGFLALLAGLIALIGSLEAGAGPEVVTVPLLFAGLGIGALASQLGAVTVGAVSDERSGEVGGLQNTFTNLGASIGTAVAGTVLIGALTTSFIAGIEENPDVPAEITEQAETNLASGAPFVSDADLEEALAEAGVSQETADAIVEENETARLYALRASLAVLALFGLGALVSTRKLPTTHAEPSPAPTG